ncbi:MAG: hydrogenase expression/formation protein HypE [Gemmatimonadaceae bacterium]
MPTDASELMRAQPVQPVQPARREVDDREREALEKIAQVRARPPRFRDEQITMAHGAGGKATATLVRGLLVPAFTSDQSAAGAGVLAALDDAGVVHVDGTGLALSTDCFVVKPLKFPGGSIGDLAVNGTVNDLAMAGARPIALTLALVLEEGLSSEVLRREVDAIARAAAVAGVSIVAGDTKVVERGHADGMYICTTGLGRIDPRARLSPASIQPGDRILVSGRIGDHGTAIMLARGEFELDAPIESDTRPLWPAADALLGAAGPALRCMRDATRGGVASVLNELAVASGVAMLVQEGAVPVHPAVIGACEILGIDPMYVANEGKLVAVVAADAAERALAALRAVPGCEDAAEIGEVHTEPSGMVLVQTAFGGRRVMDLLVGDPLPRIC